jgi:hypothetical protein
MAVISNLECVLPRPSIAALHQQLITEMSERLLGGAPVVPMSSEDVLAFVMAGTVNLMHGYVTQALKENSPATACCDNLVRYAAVHGIDMRASTRAKGYVGITGTPGAPISATIRFVGESSREYKLDPAVYFNPTALDAAGAAPLRVVAVVAGAAYDLPAGAPLTVATTLPGIDSAATVLGGGLIGGADNETCEQLRVRVLAAEAAGVVSTNMEWYLSQAATYPGVTRTCLDECQGCCDPSYVVIYPFMEGTYGDVDTAPYGVPPGEVLEAMTAWLFGTAQGMGQGLAPVGIGGQCAAAYPTVMTVTLYCFSGCPANVVERIKAALTVYLRANYCVGSRMCKEAMKAAAYAAAGPDACFSAICFGFDTSLAHEDGAFAYLDCAHFPVLGEVTLMPAGVLSLMNGVCP